MRDKGRCRGNFAKEHFMKVRAGLHMLCIAALSASTSRRSAGMAVHGCQTVLGTEMHQQFAGPPAQQNACLEWQQRAHRWEKASLFNACNCWPQSHAAAFEPCPEQPPRADQLIANPQPAFLPITSFTIACSLQSREAALPCPFGFQACHS